MDKVLAIVGPTAVGKSSFGVRCAKDFNGEIISGDSIQAYRGLDIGSGKIKKEEMEGISHYLIDILDAYEEYNVKLFQEYSRKLISSISINHKLPIIVGGTGLYIKACLYDYEFLDEEEKDDEYLGLSNEEIYLKLKELDPKALEKIHINNRKRLVRALNIVNKHNKGISTIKAEQKHGELYNSLIIGLTMEREELYKRIDNRIDEMMNNGLLEEINGLLTSDVTFSSRCMQAIGYKEFKPYFESKKSIEECVLDIKRNSHHFAKRQYTFFNNQLNVRWFSDLKEAHEEIEKWLI